MSIIDDPTAWGGWSLGVGGAAMIASALKRRNPHYILEAGSGASTVVFAEYAQRTRHKLKIISLESDAAYFTKTSNMLIDRDLRKYIDLRLVLLVTHDTPFGRAIWYRTDDLPAGIDFVLVDGPPGHHSEGRKAALPALWNLLADDFELWMDDVNRPGERRAVRQWVATYGVTATTSPAGRKQMSRVVR